MSKENTTSLIGATVYRSGGDVLRKLSLLQPHDVVVGSGAWNDIDAIAGACAPTQPLIILRDMSENLIDQKPVEVMRRLIVAAQSRFYTRVAAHLLNEAYSDVMRARAWELEAISYCKSQNIPTVALNGAYGNDPDDRFKSVADASEYVGWHLYDSWMAEQQPPTWGIREYTSRRYAGAHLPDNDWPDWWPRHKHIATEVGVERKPALDQRCGWADMGIPEETVRLRMLANALHWKADGLLGVCWFTAGHTEQSWNEGYGMTEGMAKLWGEKGPQPNQNGAQPPIDNGGADMATLKQMLDDIEAKGLAGQITLNAGKKAASYTEMGTQVDLTHNLFGDVVNLAREAKKALETPIPV